MKRLSKKASTKFDKKLKSQRAMIKGTKSEERSVAVDTGSYSNEVTEGTSKRRTPGSSAPNSHNGGEEDEGSTDLGASTVYFRTHGRHRRLILG